MIINVVSTKLNYIRKYNSFYIYDDYQKNQDILNNLSIMRKITHLLLEIFKESKLLNLYTFF